MVSLKERVIRRYRRGISVVESNGIIGFLYYLTVAYLYIESLRQTYILLSAGKSIGFLGFFVIIGLTLYIGGFVYVRLFDNCGHGSTAVNGRTGAIRCLDCNHVIKKGDS